MLIVVAGAAHEAASGVRMADFDEQNLLVKIIQDQLEKYKACVGLTYHINNEEPPKSVYREAWDLFRATHSEQPCTRAVNEN